MSQKLRAFCLACCFVVLRPALAADFTDLQASTSGSSGKKVTVAVHNPTAGPVAARVRVVVQLDDETWLTLLSSNFTVSAGATISVPLSAPAPVLEIVDDPEPIGTLQRS
jgi:hypothetical protein